MASISSVCMFSIHYMPSVLSAHRRPPLTPLWPHQWNVNVIYGDYTVRRPAAVWLLHSSVLINWLKRLAISEKESTASVPFGIFVFCGFFSAEQNATMNHKAEKSALWKKQTVFLHICRFTCGRLALKKEASLRSKSHISVSSVSCVKQMSRRAQDGKTSAAYLAVAHSESR